MAITLITGQPGHGKTLYAIDRALKFKAEGRPVYVAGIKDFDYAGTGCLPLEDFRAFDASNVDGEGRIMPNWQLLPHGSVIVIDECYDVLPQRSAGAKVPPHVDALARHRHHGYDIILICQMHNQIDSFVKGLVDPHLHIRRKFGLPVAVVKEWDRFKSSTDATDTLRMTTWKYPKSVYSKYTSATMHTVKKRIPWFIWAVPVLLGVIWWCVHNVRDQVDGGGKAVASSETKSVAGKSTVSPQDVDAKLRRDDYAAWLRPRVPGQPWTAPAYDNLQPQGVPDVYCMASEDGRCGCITEQGTRYQMDVKVCRVIARDGNYNPFRKPLDVTAPKPSQVRPEGNSAPGDSVDVVGASGLPVPARLVTGEGSSYGGDRGRSAVVVDGRVGADQARVAGVHGSDMVRQVATQGAFR